MTSDDPLLWRIALQVLLIFLNAVFASAEIAVITMRDTKIAKMTASGDRRARRLSQLTEQPSRFFATTQVGVTFAGFLGSAFAADTFSDRVTQWLLNQGVRISAQTLDSISVIAITLILSYFTLVFGELVPKRIATKKAESIALGMSGLIYFVSKAFAPVVWLLTRSTNGVLRLFGIDPNAVDDEAVSEEEIRMMVDAGSETGAIDYDEREIIQNLFEFDDKTAAEAMTHRTEVIFLWTDETDEQWEQTIIEGSHSFYPISSGNTDNVVGVLNVRKYFRLQDKSRKSVMNNAVEPPYFVPDTVRCDLLFRNMRKHRKRFAVVLDDYGGVSGIITMEDLLEELVGDLDYDITAPDAPDLVERIDENVWRVRGSAPLGKVSERLEVDLPEDDYETFGGLVFGLLGTIPDDGSSPELEAYGLSIKVEQIRERRIESAIVRIMRSPDGVTGSFSPH